MESVTPPARTPPARVPPTLPAGEFRPRSCRHVGMLRRYTVINMVTTMASKQVTITVDEELLAWFEQKAAQTGSKLSPTIAKAARNWLLWEDAARLAEADQRTGRNASEHAEAEFAAGREAEAAEAGRGHAA